MIYFVPQDLSPGAPSPFLHVIFSTSAGIVLSLDLGKSEAPEGAE